MTSLSLSCLAAAAMAYHVSMPALQAIRTVEGGQQRQEVCQNYDGSCDLGPFQVNDKVWVHTLARALRADQESVRRNLRDDGCWNAQVASWILKLELDQAGGDLQAAIGNYHSRWRAEHDRYLRKIDMVLQSLSPADAPPAMPGTAPGDSPGALRIPPDVTGPGGVLPGLPPQEQPKGKLIVIKPAGGGSAEAKPDDAGDEAKPQDGAEPKPAETAPDAPPDASAPARPDDSDTPPPRARAASPPKIYRGTGGGGT